MKYRILISGAGQLGSRYLQGLAKITTPLDIIVVDPSSGSLSRAEQRWREMQATSHHSVRYLHNLFTLPSNLDLVIVATNADIRTDLVEKICLRANVVHWVLEKVLTQSTHDLDRLKRAISVNAKSKAWVNTPMHLWPLYQKLRENYTNKPPINASFSGFSGLACNAIHYIDFISRWNDSVVTNIDTSGLNPLWYPAKRNGFFEVDGRISIEFTDGSMLTLSSDRNLLHYKAILEVDGDEWHVNESDGIARSGNGSLIEGGVILQSQLTAPMVEAIFANKSCGLPTLDQSIDQHRPLLNALLNHWNTNMTNKLDRLPIT